MLKKYMIISIILAQLARQVMMARSQNKMFVDIPLCKTQSEEVIYKMSILICILVAFPGKCTKKIEYAKD